MIYFVRHGETVFNARLLMSGRTDMPLTQKGLSQATEAGKKLSKIKFDRAYSSTLSRAKITAETILAQNPLSDCPVITDQRLLERDFGYLEAHQIRFYPFIRDYWRPDFDCEKYKVEPLSSIFARLNAFLTEINPKLNENILLVGHSGVARTLSGIFCGMTGDDDVTPFAYDNCKILAFDYARKGNYTVEEVLNEDI